jgi:hypothetical protein
MATMFHAIWAEFSSCEPVAGKSSNIECRLSIPNPKIQMLQNFASTNMRWQVENSAPNLTYFHAQNYLKYYKSPLSYVKGIHETQMHIVF